MRCATYNDLATSATNSSHSSSSPADFGAWFLVPHVYLLWHSGTQKGITQGLIQLRLSDPIMSENNKVDHFVAKCDDHNH